MNALASRPGNRKEQGLAGATRRRPETKAGGREAWCGANFAVLGVSLFCCVALAACGGGGGNGGGAVRFVSFSQLAGAGGGSPFNGTIEMQGQAVSAVIMANPGTARTTYRLGTPVSESAAVRIRVENGTLVSFDLRGQRLNENFPTADIMANIMDPTAAGYEYQTFGWWSAEPGTTSRSWSAASFGRRTEAANLPNSQATYAAQSVGMLVDHGSTFSTTSTINISTADYANVTVSSTNTMRTEILPDGTTRPATGDSRLDFTGTGTVTGSGFEANISDTHRVPSGDVRTGKAVGWFYGPDAEEVGGTFHLERFGSSHIGAFGGKKQ